MITIFQNLNHVKEPHYREIGFILDRISTDEDKALLDKIRSEKDKGARNIIKKKLVAICFSGEFSERSKAGLIEHSGFMCLDFDGYDNDTQLQEQKQWFIENEFSYSVFISPSGKGLKVVVRVPEGADEQKHLAYFNALEKYYDSSYFDTSTKDVSRICYISHDPDIYVNTDATIWTEELAVIKKKRNPIMVPIVDEDKKVESVLRAFDRNYDMYSGNRNNNMFKLAGMFNTAGVDRGIALSHCLTYVADDFSEAEVNQVISSSYGNTSEFNTYVYENYDVVKKIGKAIGLNRKPDKIASELNVNEKDVEAIAVNNKTIEFWHKSEKGALSILPDKFKIFLRANGYYKYTPDNNDNSVFVHVANHLIDDINEEKIKDFVLRYLEELDDSSIFNFFALKTMYFKDSFLNLLDNVNVSFLKDTKDFGYVYYTNGVVKVSKNNIELIEYKDLDGYVWKKSVIDRHFSFDEESHSDYEDFIFNVSGKSDECRRSMESAIGYLMHGYVDQSNKKAIIANDEAITPNPSGGSGKSLFGEGLSRMKNLVIEDGKNFDVGNGFKYQKVNIGTQILMFDDVKKNFEFERLFSVITEGIEIEVKFKTAIKLKSEDSPKVFITTNYTIAGKGNAFKRRKYDLEFSNYYNEFRQPIDDFGKDFFNGWDEKEFNTFDNYMLRCLQGYLKTGLTTYITKNILKRQLISDTNFSFVEWAVVNDSIVAGARLNKERTYNDFTTDYKDFHKLSMSKFNIWMADYIKYIKCESIDGIDMSGRYFELISMVDE